MNWAILGTIIGLIALSLAGFIAIATMMLGTQKNIGILLGRTEHLQPVQRSQPLASEHEQL